MLTRPADRTAALVAALLLLAGCGGSAGGPPARTVTRTVVHTRPAGPIAFTPPPPSTVAPLPPGHAAPRGERDGRCPYLRTGLDQTANTGVNLAELEGDRVYRTTVLTTDRPPGCRFYFFAPPYEAVADIRLRRLPTARAARDAMVLTARTGREPITERHFAGPLTGILFRTRFFGPDGARDWAFTFAAGRLLVVVHTQRSDTSRSALYIGRAVARRL